MEFILLRQFNLCDRMINQIDVALGCLFVPEQRVSVRQNPAINQPDTVMSAEEKQAVIAFMRVNHTGEVCAQALYQAQSLTARQNTTQTNMIQAAQDEIDHLAWCEERLRELNGHTSYLNFFWYSGSFILGALAGAAGDRWSLGFVAETERQVTAHLQGHAAKLPAKDHKTRLILTQMAQDEIRHANHAVSAGGKSLPWICQQSMRWMARCMTTMSSYM